MSSTAARASRAAVRLQQSGVIRVPHCWREPGKRSEASRKVATVKAGKLLIQSKHPERNQWAGQTLGKFEQPLLASKGWKHRKAFGDYFSINPTEEAPHLVVGQAEDTNVTFSTLRLRPDLVELLGQAGIRHPTEVQRHTIPKLLRGHHVLCAAETGSGKTLSYLLPVVQRLKEEDESGGPGAADLRCVVLVPSRELADQVTGVARWLATPNGLRVRVVAGGQGLGYVKQAFSNGPPHVLVATPGALVKALRRRYVDMGHLRFLVVDEADTLLDPGFADLLEDTLSYVRVATGPGDPTGAQLAVVGATFPSGVGEVLGRVTDVGSVRTVRGRMLHALMPHVKQRFVRVRGADKPLELRRLLEGQGAALVFCNSAATVNWLGYVLEGQGVRHVRLQGLMPAALRCGVFRSFQQGRVDVLLCTDLASRGLDTSRVRMVVNYDFPLSHADYLHRVGRVGRVGSAVSGEVVSFVTHPWDVELVQDIESAARKRTVLPGMESTIREPVERLEPEGSG